MLACYVDEATLKHVHIQGRNHGGTAVTCVCFYLYCAHDILKSCARPGNLVTRAHD